MAEVSLPGTAAPQGADENAARAARVTGLINAILASPNSAAIRAALSDPEIGAAAISDSGVSVLVGVLSGAGAAEELKQQLRELQPTADERKQIVDGVAKAPEQAAAATVAVANPNEGVAAGGAVQQGDKAAAVGTAVAPDGGTAAGGVIATPNTVGVAAAEASPAAGTVVATAASATGVDVKPDTIPMPSWAERAAASQAEASAQGMAIGGAAKKPAA